MSSDFPEDFIPPDLALEKKIELESKNGLADIEGYHVRVFDFSKPEEIESYCSTMTSLYSKIQEGTCILWSNEKQILTHKDGSMAWHKYLEWTEYKNKQQPCTKPPMKPFGTM